MSTHENSKNGQKIIKEITYDFTRGYVGTACDNLVSSIRSTLTMSEEFRSVADNIFLERLESITGKPLRIKVIAVAEGNETVEKVKKIDKALKFIEGVISGGDMVKRSDEDVDIMTLLRLVSKD